MFHDQHRKGQQNYYQYEIIHVTWYPDILHFVTLYIIQLYLTLCPMVWVKNRVFICEIKALHHVRMVVYPTQLNQLPKVMHIFHSTSLMAETWQSMNKYTRGLFYYEHISTSIPVCIGDHMPNRVWDEITYPFPNFDSCTVEVEEWVSNFVPYFIMDVITFPCWD